MIQIFQLRESHYHYHCHISQFMEHPVHIVYSGLNLRRI